LRYEIAEEYVQLVYKLWEGSWEDGAVVRDRANRVYARPDKVHRIQHEGKYYQLDGIHLSEPSPQRTPVLYQAGSSARGREFAARHAECVFIGGPSKEFIAPRVADLRRRAAAHGRNPDDILVFLLMTVITGPTEAAAKAKWDDYRNYVSSEGALTLISGWTGIDLANYRLDEPIEHVNGEAITSYVDAAAHAVGGRVRTVGELAAIGGSSPILVGSPVQIADELESWVDEADVDGFNLAYAVTPETFNDFVDLVVPELQRRGRYKREYRAGTLREKFFGHGRARLGYPHPAAGYRSNGAAAVDYVSSSTPR